MDMELAELFASLKFDYDSTAVYQFKKDLKEAAQSISGLSTRIDTSFTNTNTEVKRGSSAVDGFVSRVRGSYSKVRPSLDQMKKDLNKINDVLDRPNLNTQVKRQYEDLHKRVVSSIDRETEKREKAAQREAKLNEKRASEQIKQENKLRKEKEQIEAKQHRERKRYLESEAAERRRMMRQRLRDVLNERKKEYQLTQQQHRQNLRNQKAEQREALTSRRHLRNKLTSIGAIAGGIGGIYSLGESVKGYQDYQGAMSGLSAATGSPEKAEKDFDWLHQLSSKLGLFMGDITKGYTSLAANTKSAGIDDNSTKKMFESVLSYSRVLNLGKGDVDGVIRGLSQMVGKGKLNSEEVRQQVGERLPGFIPAAAKSMGFGEGQEGTAKFFKELESGNLTAKKLFDVLPDELMKMSNAGNALEKAMNTTSAAIGRLQTNFWLANKTFNEAGFDKGVRRVVNRISESVDKMNGLWKILGKTADYFGGSIEAPIELIGTLSKAFSDATGGGENFSKNFKRLCAGLIVAIAPLRKAFSLFWVLPTGLSALNDLIEHWQKGDLGQKNWKELTTEIGFAAGAIAILVGMAAKVFRLTSNLKALGSALARIKRNPALKKTAEDIAESSSGGSAGTILGGSGKSSKKRGGRISRGVTKGANAAGMAYLAADSFMPDTSEGSEGGLGDYLRGIAGGASTGVMLGSAAGGGPWGSLVGAAAGGVLGGLQPYSRSLDKSFSGLGNTASVIPSVYQAGSRSLSTATGIGRDLGVPNVGTMATKGLSALPSITNTLSNPTSDNLQNVLQQFGANPQVPQSVQNIQTQNTIDHKVDNMNVNVYVNGNDSGEMRETMEDILRGHMRSAVASRPRAEE